MALTSFYKRIIAMSQDYQQICLKTHQMSNESLNRLIVSQLANMNLLIGAAAGKRRVRLPIYIERWCIMERELLCRFACLSIPDDCRLIDARREDVVAALVPLERKNWTFMLAESVAEMALGGPNACIAVI